MRMQVSGRNSLPNMWRFAVVLSTVLSYFSLLYLFGLAATLDRSGRWAAVAGSANLMGFAVGPIVAGAEIASSGYTTLAAVSVAMIGISWALL
ncbi:hypothetical protein AM571_PC00123 (plasmid) [Rhizobium etli 8C-3]|uniref:Major facilitator superfamily domain-containing protein n=1 Tax=Rhizobium etli 8C-3 TaxID=538025 RepID=A0A1L5PCH4_RHIET|nr:hypothetical protein AM571_PC00123 [Rhizobium etli 8C-3]